MVVCCRGNFTEVWGYTAYMPSCVLLPRRLHYCTKVAMVVVSKHMSSFMHTWSGNMLHGGLDESGVDLQ